VVDEGLPPKMKMERESGFKKEWRLILLSIVVSFMDNESVVLLLCVLTGVNGLCCVGFALRFGFCFECLLLFGVLHVKESFVFRHNASKDSNVEHLIE
jgi:hypothetical protein